MRMKMLLGGKSLNKNIPIPLYYQLKMILMEYIREQHANIDEPIPTEIEISEYFGISRPTVRQAINELVVEGYLYRVKAKGTFITKPKITQDFLLTLDSFNNEMRKKGLVPSTRILEREVIECDEKIAKVLKLEPGSEVIKLTRLRCANNEPIVFVITYVPYRLCPILMESDLENESMYGIIERESGKLISNATRTLECIMAGEFEARLLNIEKGAPVQYFESVVFLADGTPVEYSLAKYRSDRSKFTFELRRH
jgi:GntR family transcriptional regulator